EKGNLYYYRKLTGLPILGKLPQMTEAQLGNPEEIARLAEQNVQLDRILELADKATE
ncbi:MAG TPA: dethiobiotin synthase, partial [Acidaminococcaceae bacterium]|nr:dethiobiotin synthase [Acidaminococcaceae bacterium]